MASPVGFLKRAAEPKPSTVPETPGEPAIVVTEPVETMILRMVWLALSAT